MEITRTNTAVFEDLGDGILRMEIFKGARMDIETVVNDIKVMKEFGKGQKSLVYADGRGVGTATKEARKYFAQSEEAVNSIKAIAVRIDSGMSKIIGNFILMLNKPNYPIKMFNSEEKAIEWLNTF